MILFCSVTKSMAGEADKTTAAIPQLPLWQRFISLFDDQGGASAILFAVVLTGLCGVVGLSMDLGMWYRTTRALQNASDAAAIAAARDGTSSYQSTGKAVAAQYGFVDGVGGITV